MKDESVLFGFLVLHDDGRNLENVDEKRCSKCDDSEEGKREAHVAIGTE